MAQSVGSAYRLEHGLRKFEFLKKIASRRACMENVKLTTSNRSFSCDGEGALPVTLPAEHRNRNSAALIKRVEAALDVIRSGGMIIVVDDDDRENEGDLLAAAELITPEMVNFMALHGRGLICMPLEQEAADRLDLEPMVPVNTESMQTAFTVSIDADKGITTGISAYDRARTIKTAADPESRPESLRRPGHIFPLIARDGGVLVRTGHTEAAVDLAKAAGLSPAGVICEIMNEDGSMARMPQLEVFAEKHGLMIISVEDIIEYRRRKERLIVKVADIKLPTSYGEFKAFAYNTVLRHGDTHLALVMGELNPDKAHLVRVHSECLTGDVFRSRRCDCGEQLDAAMELIAKEGGVLLYMRQEGRGIGLANKLKAYALQDKGRDTVEANVELGFPPDLRDYGIGAQILYDLGLRRIRLITNNPRKIVGLEGYGLSVVERVSLEIPANEKNRAYLRTKRHKMGHYLTV
jgi:3,4-dihydroxy 2-butanone 4-phosphate synthase/GTP cyclohydrolase II